MKKTFTFLSFTIIIALISCTKDVKSPVAKVLNSTAATLPSTTTQTTAQEQSGHTCGGDHSNNGNGY